MKKLKWVIKSDKMFFALFSFGLCWNEELLTVGLETAFRILGDNGPQMIQKVLDIADEKLERPSLAAAWLAYLERPPYNTDCFNHWRYSQNSLNLDIKNSQTVIVNQDDLLSTLKSLNKSIISQTLNGAWPFNFGFKAFTTLYFEAFDPIHATLFFDDQKNSDNNGRNFTIKYKGKSMSLHDFWDSGCGRYTYQTPFTKAQWKDIDDVTTKLYGTTLSDRIEQFGSASVETASDFVEGYEQNFNLSKEFVYKNLTLKQNEELDSDYVSKCEKLTDIRLLQAATLFAKTLKYYTLPTIPKNPPVVPFKASEGVAWGILFFMTPVTIYLLWKYIHSKVKSD